MEYIFRYIGKSKDGKTYTVQFTIEEIENNAVSDWIRDKHIQSFERDIWTGATETINDGKKIFVNDVIRNGNNIWMYVYWDETYFQFRHRVCNRKQVQALGFRWSDNPTDISLYHNFKIIEGNIHQSPELKEE